MLVEAVNNCDTFELNVSPTKFILSPLSKLLTDSNVSFGRNIWNGGNNNIWIWKHLQVFWTLHIS